MKRQPTLAKAQTLPQNDLPSSGEEHLHDVTWNVKLNRKSMNNLTLFTLLKYMFYILGIKPNAYWLNSLCVFLEVGVQREWKEIRQVAYERNIQDLIYIYMKDYWVTTCFFCREAGALKAWAKVQCLFYENCTSKKKKKRRKKIPIRPPKIKHCSQWRSNHGILAFERCMCVHWAHTYTLLKSATQIKEPCRRIDSSRRAEAGGSKYGIFIETTVVKRCKTLAYSTM